ncbi:MAG: MBL fold metallo-hydrolase, partial [Chloroflexota bacterium]
LHGNVLLINTGEQNILIDAGLPTGPGSLVANLAQAGVAADQIDIVIVTHGDGDHIGGLANYPNAKIVTPSHAYTLWTEDTDGMVEDFLKLFRDVQTAEELAATAAGRAKYANVLRNLGDRLVMVEPGEEIAAGITMISAPGHRRDHMAVEVRSGDDVLLHVADAWRHPVQLARPDFYGLFDSFPDILADTMLSLLERAAETDALVFGAHFSFPALIKIKKEDGQFHWIDL